MASPLLLIPDEILANIAFHLASLSPPALPDLILPLRSAAKALYFRLSPSANPSLYARIFRLKFDSSAVCRRAFLPEAENYADHLIHYYRLLVAIQRRDFAADDASFILFDAYIMMLENDGKNRAQLEWAGIDLYLGAYMRLRMYHPLDRITNDGWPRDSAANACALWLMWMFTTLEKLHAESLEEREQIANSALPFASIPFRYASAHVPPLHFKLPPTTSVNGDDDNFFSIQTVHGLYPIYRPSEFARSQFYYGSRPLLTHPLASEAARLVYQSRRDMALFPIPPHLPLTRADAIAAGLTEVIPTQEDVRELNAHKSARLVKRIIWDWDRGMAVVPGESNELAYVDASRDWDCDWWRLRCCLDAWRKELLWRPGRLYMPGTLSGLWQGKMLIPSEMAMMHFLNIPEYPSPFFSETTLTITSRPIFMRLSEHHCLDQQSRLPTPHQKTGPFRDDGVQNAWFPGPPGSLRWQLSADRPGNQRIKVHTLSGLTAEYHTYNPERNKSEWLGYEHDRDSCPGCIAREEVVTSAAQVERRKWKELEEQQREQAFASVGLCRGTGIPFQMGNSDMEIDEEAVDGDENDASDDDSDWDAMDDEYDEDPTLPPVRKSQDWVKNVVECDGVRDVIVTGATDDAHGQAWQHYTYYGRVRPWDGLIGILRVPRATLQGTSIIYGYISGGKNFSGNWRWALADPAMPAWECAVVMSKREE